jgi:hypothetical protein
MDYKTVKNRSIFYFQQNWSGSVLKTDQFFIKKNKANYCSKMVLVLFWFFNHWAGGEGEERRRKAKSHPIDS